VASTEAQHEEENRASVAAACAFEAGRAAFRHLPPVTFRMTLACSGVTTTEARLTGLLQQVSRFTARKSEKFNMASLPERGWLKHTSPSSRITANYPLLGQPLFNNSPLLFSVLQMCILSIAACSICSMSSNVVEQQDYPVGMSELV